MTLSLRARLATISTIVFGILLGGLSVTSYAQVAQSLDADATRGLADLAHGLHGYLHIDREAVSIAYDADDDDQAAFIHRATQYYQVYDVSTGRLLAQSGAFAPLGLELTPAEVQAFAVASTPFDITTQYGRLRVFNDVGRDPDGREYLLQVGASLEPMDRALSRYREILWWRMPVALLVAVLCSFWLSTFALRPLSRAAAATHAIDVTSLDRRLPVRGAGDELDELANAFNEVLRRLERAVGEMRQFSAALAHELRTPLAALRGQIELSLRDRSKNESERLSLASQIEDIDRLARLIDRILTLARAESGQIRLRMAPVDIGALAASLVEQVEPVARARTLELHCERTDVVVEGDAAWLGQMVLNLLDNAIKYTNANGRIDVRVSRDGDVARIDVQDTGVGLSPEDARHVFERFFRVDPARSSTTEGAGLGLSLVQWIAAQHQGIATVQSRQGHGSTFTVTLPLSQGTNLRPAFT